ncbi:MAG: DUF3180 domain-containing protein [Marmoricola sp.]
MTRDPDPDEGGPDRDPDEEPQGSIHATSVAALCVFAAVGLIVGWAIRPLSLGTGHGEPAVSWLPIGLVWFLAAIVAGTAYFTWRTHRARLRMEPHRAVNRLVLGKACSLVGALLAGGYFGFALAHLGVSASDQAGTQLWHSVVAGAGGIVTMVAALLLEQACRVRRDDD